jgi:hypothetical protein
LRPNQKLHGNQCGTLLKKKLFGTMRLWWQVHTWERTKLINSRGKLMKCVDFKKGAFWWGMKCAVFKAEYFGWRKIALHYEKNGCFATSLATQFLSCKGHLQSLYLYTVSANEQVAWVAIHHIYDATHCNLINSFSITMQLHCNCTHDVTLTSLIIIHLLRSNAWHYKKN